MKDVFSLPSINDGEQESRRYREFLQTYLKKTESSFQESEGFLLIPAENVTITPYDKKIGGGLIEIKEPEQKIGVDKFDIRDSFEKNYPQEITQVSIQQENKIFSGEKNAENPFHPHSPLRFCLNSIKIFENAKESFILLPIIPASGQQYEGHLKLPGTSIIRGNRFPQSNELLKFARSKQVEIPRKQFDKDEPVLSPEQLFKTGIWTVKFINDKGRYSQIFNCHLWRDQETGTLDAFIIRKQYVFQDIDDFDFQDKLSNELGRANALVSLNDLLQKEEGQPLPLKHLYLGEQKIEKLSDLPEKYRPMFSQTETGEFYLKEIKHTPPMRAFLKYEKRVIENNPESIEHVKSKAQELKRVIRQKIGALFEQLISKALNIAPNKDLITYRLDKNINFSEILKTYPDDFKDWAKNYIETHHAIVLKPDFILADGTLVEAKSGEYLDAADNLKQINKMFLYKILSNAKNNIQIISLQTNNQLLKLPGVTFEQIENSDLKDKIDPEIWQEIQEWKTKL